MTRTTPDIPTLMQQQQGNRTAAGPRLATASGFTITELMIALALVGILFVFALPAFQVLIKNNCLTTTSNDFLAFLRYARSEAIKRRADVTVSVTPSLWRVLTGPGGNIVLRERIPTCPAEMTGSWGSSFVVSYYAGRGQTSAAAAFSVCDDRTGEEGREIKVSLSGRAAVSRKTCT